MILIMWYIFISPGKSERHRPAGQVHPLPPCQVQHGDGGQSCQHAHRAAQPPRSRGCQGRQDCGKEVREKVDPLLNDFNINFLARFVRSVARVFVVFQVELSPGTGKKKSIQSANLPVQRCKRVFTSGSLVSIAIEELCETANSLLAPVR